MITDLERMQMNLDGIAEYLDVLGLKALAGYAREAVDYLTPVKPTLIGFDHYCGNCGTDLYLAANYCTECGKKVKWSE